MNEPEYHRVESDFTVSSNLDEVDLTLPPSQPIEIRYHKPEEEIALVRECGTPFS